MDEETTMLNEQTEDAGTPDALDAAFDLGFDDDGPIIGEAEQTAGEEPETQESEEKEADADQQEADWNEGGDADEGTESESAGDEGHADQGDFILKHLGEEKSVSRDEVVALAQKGMDYDRIREKWDGVKNDIQKLRMYEGFLAELAEARGGDIESLIDETRIRTLMARAEARGEDLSPAAAAAMAVKMRTDFNPANADPEEARQERSVRETERFMKEYPNVMATDIPKEVWDRVNENGGDLVAAYMQYENASLKNELKTLKKDLEAAKQQTKNKQRSTGSTKSVGSSKTKDPFEEGWDAS